MLGYLRKKFQSMNIDRLQTIRLGLAFTYAIVGWHAAIYVYYLLIKEDLPSTSEKRKAFIERVSPRYDSFQHVKIEGLTVKENIIHNKDTNKDVSNLDEVLA